MTVWEPTVQCVCVGVVKFIDNLFTGFFFKFIFVSTQHSKKECDGDEIASISDIRNESISDISSSDSDCKRRDADGESESGTNDSEPWIKQLIKWLQVTDLDPGPNTSTPQQIIEAYNSNSDNVLWNPYCMK